MSRQHGFTLLELLICLAIISILLLTASPKLGQLIHKNEADASINMLFRGWQHARSLAISRSTRVMVCGSDDGINCQKEWRRQLILFIDANKDFKPDHDEVLQHYEINSSQGTLQTRVGFGGNYAYLEPTGKAPLTGSFLYCHTKDSSLERKISWNLTGRLYLTGNHTTHTGTSTVHCPDP